MCGIFAFIKSQEKMNIQNDTVKQCIEGLKLLEYRGYDSSGIAGLIDGKIKSCKRPGKIQSLQEAVTSQKLRLDIAIAHTRWATHGIPSQENAHPHFNQKKTLALVHNGIIENHNYIREKLTKKGIQFESETDTEVIAKLICHNYKGNLRIAIQKSLKVLKGSLAIAVIHKDHPNTIVSASRESPLVIGIDKKNKEGYISSDPNSFNGKRLEIFYLKDDEIALLNHDKMVVYNSSGKKIVKETKSIGFASTSISKSSYEHYMLKEIHEQPQILLNSLKYRLNEKVASASFEEIKLTAEEMQSKNRILILACGTSWHAGCIASSIFEQIAKIPTETKIASEFRYTNSIIPKNTLVIAISQSGETADTIAAVREAKAKGATVIGLCNVPHSTLSRETHSCLFLRAGPEISVCSTKAFTSQLMNLSLFSLYLARLRHLNKKEGEKFIEELKQIPEKVCQTLSQSHIIEKHAKDYANFNDFFYIGRQYMFPSSLEAALKLKEISYLNANGYPAGEMKHGPIALIDPNSAVIGLLGNEHTISKALSNLMEIKARKGRIFAFAPQGTNEILNITKDIVWMPRTIDPLAPILYSVGTQLFAYYIALTRGTNIDQPRNLAKSVTVE